MVKVKSKDDSYNRKQQSSCLAQLLKFSCYTTLSLGAVATAIIAGMYYQPEMAAKYMGEENFDGLKEFAQEYATKEWLESALTRENLTQQGQAAITFFGDLASKGMEYGSQSWDKCSEYMSGTPSNAA